MEWISFDEKEPPAQCALDDPSVSTVGNVLATNNIDARDRMGRMSHVWYLSPHKDSKTGEWSGYTDASREVTGLTHWSPVSPPNASTGRSDT